MKYKDTSDIKYVDFEKFYDAIDGRDDEPEYIAEMIMLIFFPKYPIKSDAFCVSQFNKALKTPGKIQNYKIDFDLRKAANFINLDTYIRDYPLDFLKNVLKTRVPFFRSINVNKVSLATAQNAFKLFMYELPE